MKTAIYCKDKSEKKTFEKQLGKLIEIQIHEIDPNYVFVFGGDGTFLDAFNHYGYRPVYIPINTGNLGFFSSWNINEINKLNFDIPNNHIEEFSLLEISYQLNNQEHIVYSVNEITMIDPLYTQSLNIYLNGQLLEEYKGSGICISSPAGSTGFNKSLGGALIDKNLAVMQLTKLAPLSNIKYQSFDNPIVVDKNTVITIESRKKSSLNSVLTYDRSILDAQSISKFNVKVSLHKVKILVDQKDDFWNRLRKAFL